MSISPGYGGSFGADSDPSWRPQISNTDRPKWFTLAILLALVGLAGVSGYLFTLLRATRTELAQANTKIKAHEEQLAKLEGSLVSTSRQNQENLSSLKEEVTAAKGEIHQAAREAQSITLAKTQQIAEKLRAEQKAAVAKVGGDLEQQLKTVASNTDSKLGSLSGDVSGVRTEISSTREELRKTIAELKSVRGDLGVQSGLIATNSSELGALKRLGERNYFEFDLKKAKQPQRVGTVSMKLKATDTKRNRYTMEVLADDKLTEKKDRTINEPVQFYVAKVRIPYEIVVNQVAKDRIVGYLATPKDQAR